MVRAPGAGKRVGDGGVVWFGVVGGEGRCRSCGEALGEMHRSDLT